MKKAPLNKTYEVITAIISLIAAITLTVLSSKEFPGLLDRVLYAVMLYVIIELPFYIIYRVFSFFVSKRKQNAAALESSNDESFNDFEKDIPKTEDEESSKPPGSKGARWFVVFAPVIFFTYSFVKIYQLSIPYSTVGMVVVNGRSWPFEDATEAYLGCFIISVVISYLFVEIYQVAYNGKDSKGVSAKWAIIRNISIIMLIVLLTIGALYASTHQCEVITEGGYTNYKLTSKEHYSWQEIDYFTFDPGDSHRVPRATVTFKDGVTRKIFIEEFYDYMSKDVEALEDSDDFIEKLFTEKYAHLRVEIEATK